MGKPIVVSIIGDNRDLHQAVGQSESRLTKFGKVGRAAALGAAGGLAIAGAAAVKFVQAAAEDQQAATLMAKQFRNSAHATREQISATEDWITQQGKAKGVADDDLRPALSSLIVATHDVGKAQKLAGLAMDISAAKGLPLTVVAKALAKAQNGQVAGLGKLGIATKDAAGKTKSFTQLTGDLATQFGGAATTKANTFQGKMDRLKLMLSETGETIGYKLLPIVTKLATWFIDKAVPAISKFGAQLGEKLGPVLRDVGDFITNRLIPAIKPLVEKYIASAQKGFENLSSKLGQMRPFLDLLSAAFKGLWIVVSKVLLPVIGKLYQVVLPALGTGLGIVAIALGKVGDVGKFMWNNVLAPVFRFMAGAIGTALDLMSRLFAAIGKIPKMGWAKDLANDLQNAADKARAVKDGIQNIPTKKTVTIDFRTNQGPILNLINQMPQNQRTTTTTGSGSTSTQRSMIVAAPSQIAAPVNITVQVPPTVNPAEVGRVTVAAIREFYDAGGARL